MEEISSPETQMNFENSNPKHTCLVCGHPIQAVSETESVESLTELFNTFSKYMCWKIAEDKVFEFQTEIFPFCKSCRCVVNEIFNLNEQLQGIVKQVDKLTTNVTAKIVSSQERRNKNIELVEAGRLNLHENPISEDSHQASIYNPDKIEYYRGIALKRFSPLICVDPHEADICGKIKKYRSCVDSEDSTSNAQPGGCGPIIGDFDLRDIVSECTQKVRALQFVLYEESTLGLTKFKELWTCCACHRRFRNISKRTMELHLITACGEVAEDVTKPEEIPLQVRELVIQHWKAELSGFKTVEEISRLTNVSESTVLDIIENYKLNEWLKNCREEVLEDKKIFPYHNDSVSQPPGHNLGSNDSLARVVDEPEINVSHYHNADPRSAVDVINANAFTSIGNGLQSDANFEWSRVLKDQIQKVGYNKYVYDGKISFEQIDSIWFCSACGERFVHRKYLEVHLMMGCKDKPLSVRDKLREFEGPEVKTLRWSNFMKKRTRKVGNNTYLFDNKAIIERRIHGGVYSWVCGTCHQWLGIDKAIEKHVRPGCKAENNPAMHINKLNGIDFEFKGFGFHRTENGQFKCNHCYYSASAKSQQRILDHINGIHIRQLSIANLPLVHEEASTSSTSSQSELPPPPPPPTVVNENRPSEAMPSIPFSWTIPESSPVVNIDNTNFQFKGFGFHKTDNGYFKCNHCYYSSSMKVPPRILDHISGIHIRQLSIANLVPEEVNRPSTSSQSEVSPPPPIPPPPIAENVNHPYEAEDNPAMHIIKMDDINFQFKGFGFHRTENGCFKCNHCYYSASAKSQQRILDHISGIHIRQLSIANLVPHEVNTTPTLNPNELPPPPPAAVVHENRASETVTSNPFCWTLSENNPVVNIDDTNFQFKGFGFHRAENGHFKCNHCYYSSSVKTPQRILDHISGIHIRQLSIANLVTGEVCGSSTWSQSGLSFPPTVVTDNRASEGKEMNMNEDLKVGEINKPCTTEYNPGIVKTECPDVEGIQYMDTSNMDEFQHSIFGF